MSILYTLGLRLYYLAALLSAPFYPKAKLWLQGRNSWKKIKIEGTNIYWMHCASAGEFEQGLPIIQYIQKKNPEISWLVSFFSPSGYELFKDSKLADGFCYLPLDLNSNIEQFLDHFNPQKAIFIKSEIWPNFWTKLAQRNIPFCLAAASFHENHRIFSSSNKLWKGLLNLPSYIFTQEDQTRKKLENLNIDSEVITAGNPRVDRVLNIKSSSFKDEVLEHFTSEAVTICIGSSWPEDIRVISEWYRPQSGKVKLIIAPHDVSLKMIDTQMKILGIPYQLYSEYSEVSQANEILVIDSIGLLSRVYRYVQLSYIGGGFGAGIHNILEPSVYGIGVIFGPKHSDFPEAIDLLKIGTAITIRSAEELKIAVDTLITKRSETVNKLETYFSNHAGSAEVIAEKTLKM